MEYKIAVFDKKNPYKKLEFRDSIKNIELNKGCSTARITIKVQRQNIKTILPVIYVPGIFGSRLEKNELGDGETELKAIWDPDDSKLMLKNFVNGFVGSAVGSDVYWPEQKLNKKTSIIHTQKDKSQIMRSHHTKLKPDIIDAIKQGKGFHRILDRNKIDPRLVNGVDEDEDEDDYRDDFDKIDKLADAEYKRRASRGWMGVLKDYAELMEHIEAWRHDDFKFPAFAFGYDWRQDLSEASGKFKEFVNEVISKTEYPELGTEGIDYFVKPQQKAIIVTHSMGGIMSRYASQIDDLEDKIHSIININQPATGAPVLYRRFLTGMSDEKHFSFFNPIDSVKDNIFSEILGSNPYHLTRMAGILPGALQLLPTNDHICEETIDKHWLQIQSPFVRYQLLDECNEDETIEDLDIYTVYKSEAAGLLACKRYDRDGYFKPYSKEEFKRIQYTDDHGDTIDQWVNELSSAELKKIKEPTDSNFETDYVEYYENETPYTKDNYRLRFSKAGKNKVKDYDGNIDEGMFGDKVLRTISIAEKFHTELGTQQHKNSFAITSTGKDTFNQVIITTNADGVLESPYREAQSPKGDGTVPLTSQEGLLRAGGKRSGEVITSNFTSTEGGTEEILGSNDITHANMPNNRHAIKQVLDTIATLIKNNKDIQPVQQKQCE